MCSREFRSPQRLAHNVQSPALGRTHELSCESTVLHQGQVLELMPRLRQRRLHRVWSSNFPTGVVAYDTINAWPHAEIRKLILEGLRICAAVATSARPRPMRMRRYVRGVLGLPPCTLANTNLEPPPGLDDPGPPQPPPGIDDPKPPVPAPGVDLPPLPKPPPGIDTPKSPDPPPGIDAPPEAPEPSPGIDAWEPPGPLPALARGAVSMPFRG